MRFKHYNNIIFDLGGVLLNLDYKLTERAFVDLGLKDFNSIYSQHVQTAVFEQFEKGKMSASDFRNNMRNYLNKHVTDADIDTAWNAMLLDFPPERIRFLETIKKTHRIFLLSNTNEIHIEAYSNYMKKKFGLENELSHLFEKQYYSNKIGMRKPDLQVFEFVIKENSLNPADTLFIDDSAQHVQAAMQVGINAHFLNTETETVIDLFT